MNCRAGDDFKGRHFEAWLIIQAVGWYLRHRLSFRDVEHDTIHRRALACAPEIEKQLRQIRRPHCGSIRVDETCVKVRGEWRYL